MPSTPQVDIASSPPLDPRRWTALSFIALAQLMVALDTTVVNIAIPSAQADLHMSDIGRQWIMGAYALAFGGLLLFGGRVADLIGRRRTFILGLLGFAVASVLGGVAVNAEMLITARALQGAFGALVSPAALAMITVSFSAAEERGKAFGVYNAVAGSGSAMGLLLGGVLTQYLTWRWTFYMVVPFAIIAAVGVFAVIREPADGCRNGRLDFPGLLLATTGLVLFVLAFGGGEGDGGTAGVNIGLLAVAVALLVAFTIVESRVTAPLLPLQVVAERNRGGIYLALGLAVMSMYALFLFMSYYLQIVRGYSPVVTGLGFLPVVAGLVIGSTLIGGRLLPLVAPRLLIGGGFAVAAIGVLLLTDLQVDSGYGTLVLPAGTLLGLGLGTAFVPAMSLATEGVEPRDVGVASAMVNAVQLIGGSIGTVLLNNIAAHATAGYLNAHPVPGGTPGQSREIEMAAMVHGFAAASWWTVGILLLAALIIVITVRRHSDAQALRAG
jgi:EmrB/QacA subfamily drug resistance transporter